MNTHFEILETLALKDGRWQNWPLHWARLQITAHHFRYPLMQMQLESDMAQLAQKHAEGHWRVRLALSVTGAARRMRRVRAGRVLRHRVASAGRSG